MKPSMKNPKKAMCLSTITSSPLKIKDILMKKIKYILAVLVLTLTATSCEKIIDIDPISNIGTDQFYKNYNEVNIALTGCYNGMHGSMYNEWMMTELRSDNAKQGVPSSTNVANTVLNELDMYTLNSSHIKVYDYWIATYKNIRSINYVLRSLGVTYVDGQLVFGESTAKVTLKEKNQLAGEALFLRAYHYFNLTRLFGGTFLLTEPLEAADSKKVPRSSVQEMYQLITSDLTASKDLLLPKTFAQISANDLGRATTWAAKALLAKVYLTNDQKEKALPLLDDVIDHSGYGLLNSYADVFSTTNEMNKEIIFAVRYKAGGLGLGSPMANLFSPTASGTAVINAGGDGNNYPTESLKAAYVAPPSGAADKRKDVNVAVYNGKSYVKKYISQVSVKYDAENDFPVIRFADVLLMKAEALGFDGPSGVSVGLINQIRTRAGAQSYPGGTVIFNSAFYTYPAAGTYAIADDAAFENALFNERRVELAFENQRFFDMLRTGKAVTRIQAYYAQEFDIHYKSYRPVVTLAQVQANVTEDRLLLPIPQREIDTNNQMEIVQNSGY